MIILELLIFNKNKIVKIYQNICSYFMAKYKVNSIKESEKLNIINLFLKDYKMKMV